MACMARCHEKAKIKTNTKTNNRKKTKQHTQYEQRQGASNQHLSKCHSYKPHGLTTTPLNPKHYNWRKIIYFNHLALDCLNKASSQAMEQWKIDFRNISKFWRKQAVLEVISSHLKNILTQQTSWSKILYLDFSSQVLKLMVHIHSIFSVEYF